jgi:membrane protease YdiL (CAAX protease family)
MNDPTTNDELLRTTAQEGPDANQAPLAGFVPLARPVTVEALASTTAESDPWPPQMTRLRALIELLLLVPAGFLGMLVVVIPFSIRPPADQRWLNICSSVGMGVGTLTACALMMLIARRKPASIGWTTRNLPSNVGLGLASAVALYVTFLLPLGIAFPQLAEHTEATQKAIERTFPPIGLGGTALLLTFVALWEEVIFRGFVMTRLQAILRRWWLTIPVASIVFGAIHGYEGLLAMIMITILALVMSVLFVWRRSLVAPMVLHWLHNMMTLLVLRTISTTWQ